MTVLTKEEELIIRIGTTDSDKVFDLYFELNESEITEDVSVILVARQPNIYKFLPEKCQTVGISLLAIGKNSEFIKEIPDKLKNTEFYAKCIHSNMGSIRHIPFADMPIDALTHCINGFPKAITLINGHRSVNKKDYAAFCSVWNAALSALSGEEKVATEIDHCIDDKYAQFIIDKLRVDSDSESRKIRFYLSGIDDKMLDKISIFIEHAERLNLHCTDALKHAYVCAMSNKTQKVKAKHNVDAYSL